jgi:hypothetical protein
MRALLRDDLIDDLAAKKLVQQARLGSGLQVAFQPECERRWERE